MRHPNAIIGVLMATTCASAIAAQAPVQNKRGIWTTTAVPHGPIPRSFADIADRLSPAVDSTTARVRIRQRPSLPEGVSFGELLPDLGEAPVARNATSLGSAFIISDVNFRLRS